MRIQHNIPAMNSYRNYNTNANALSKNLEKLSSGYRINRAGDDAAGLAISEKMRAQITGLDAAQKNVQDGISLVKTAEGALQEVQDMLNRMTYLATQSANGTYQNDVDRENLQKEVEALKSEINRIADSSNFNGQKLLNGELSDGAINATYKDMSAADIKGLMLAEGTVVGTNTVVETDADASNLSTFTINLDGLSHVTKAAGGDSIALKVGGQELEVNGAAVKLGTAAGDKLGAKEIAAAHDGAKVTIDNIDYTAKDNGDGTLTLTADATSATPVNAHYDVTYSAVTGTNVAATAATVVSAAVTALGADGDLTIAGKAYAIDDVAGANNTLQAQLGVWAAAYNADAGNTEWRAAVSADNKSITFTAKEAGAVATTGATAPAGTLTDGTDAYTNGTSGSLNVATVDIKATTASNPNQLANTVLDLSGKLTDGAKITLGDSTYTIALGADSKFKDAEGVVYLEKKDATEAEIASKLTEVAADNGTFSVSHTSADGKIGLQQLSAVKGSTDMSSMDKIASFIGVSTVDTTKEVVNGSALTLQIGDSSDDYNQLNVDISDMHVDALGIKDVDISTLEGAQKAIDDIKAAINSVSSTRGDLGAIQNRLEHTANNLSVMEENIQNAESAIRDTDIADEMTAYTKNNILLQSAQAMLAQANQMPQGVLQLLQ